ncbi:hypothetical protein J1614_002685 [Plenodomus biglobosus]|nr:hypothetical protein J1614_002685 [Plenodomus biglobosus]
MATQAEVLEQYYGVETRDEACKLFHADVDGPQLQSTTTLQLPYELQDHPPLPSIDEVCRIGAVIIKSCSSWCLIQEAEDMLYLTNNSQARIPALYAAFSHDTNGDPDRRRYYIMMEDIQGEMFTAALWLRSSKETRKIICSRLVEQLRLLRATPAPSYYGRVHHQGWQPLLNLFGTRYKELLGPFDSYGDFCKTVVATARFRAASSAFKFEDNPEKVLVLSDLESKIESWSNSRPTFTHIDISPGNVIVRQIQNPDDGNEDWEVTMIDWANSGWYPQWMQAVTIEHSLHVYDLEDCYPEERPELLELISEFWEESYTEQVELFIRLSDLLHYEVH